MSFCLVEQASSQVPLVLTVDQEGVGGVTGLSPTVALRDATTLNSYLDFADGTFKTGAWTTKYQSLSEVERGHYQLLFDAGAVGAIAAGTILAAEYRVDNGAAIIGDDHDLLYFVENLNDLAASGDPMDLLPGTVAGIVDDVWDEPVAGHQTAGTFGMATNQLSIATTAASGSSTTEIRTGLTQADGFYDGMQVTVVNSAGTVTRAINSYTNTNGALFVDALPFTPALNDPVIIHRRVSGVGATAAAIADAVWDETLTDHLIPGSTGDALSLAASGGGGGTSDLVVISDTLYNFTSFTDTVANPETGSAADRRIDLTVDPETHGSGKLYIETDLSIIYIAFGDGTVDADISSIRLVGGAPWAVATRGYSHVSLFAAADIPITVWGLIGVPGP